MSTKTFHSSNQKIEETKNKSSLMFGLYMAWFSASIFYAFQYVLRIAPNVMGMEIWKEFNISSEEFATLTSLSLLFYALLQIPIGKLTDHIGVKSVMLTSVLLCIVGNTIFAMSSHFYLLQIARIIIGIGSASAFLCSLKTVADHFPVGKRGLLMGLTLTMGTMTAKFAGDFVVLLVEEYGWRFASNISSTLGLLSFVLGMIFLKPFKKVQKVQNLYSSSKYYLLKNIMHHIKNKKIIIYAILTIGVYTPLSVLADTWGGIFLERKYDNILSSEAKMISLDLYLGIGIGSIILPWLCEKYNVLKEGIAISTCTTLILFAILVYVPAKYSENYLHFIMLSIGFFCGAEMLCFTAVTQISNTENSGTIIGIVNTFNMLIGAMLPQIIGMILSYRWDGTQSYKGTPNYTIVDYQVAMSSMILVIFICVLISIYNVIAENQSKKCAITVNHK